MTKKVYTAILGAVVAPLLLGASLVAAQNQSAQNQPTQNGQQTTQQNAQPGIAQGNQMGMDMSMMMDCCKKMGMNMKRPTTGSNNSSERIPSSNQ